MGVAIFDSRRNGRVVFLDFPHEDADFPDSEKKKEKKKKKRQGPPRECHRFFSTGEAGICIIIHVVLILYLVKFMNNRRKFMRYIAHSVVPSGVSRL